IREQSAAGQDDQRLFSRGDVRLPPLPTEYSATIVRSDGDRSRIFVRSDRRRIEMNFQNGHRHVVIARGDLGVGWIWQNADPWIETAIDWQMISGDADPSTALSWQEIGHLDIDGQTCKHFKGLGGESCDK